MYPLRIVLGCFSKLVELPESRKSFTSLSCIKGVTELLTRLKKGPRIANNAWPNDLENASIIDQGSFGYGRFWNLDIS